VIRGNSASDSGFGFLIRDASHGTVADNKVFGNCTGIAFLNTGAPGPVTGWRATDNDVYHNDRFCPGGDEGPARSGGGIGLIGSTKVVVGHNKVWANHPSKPNPFSGGIIAASSKAFGGSVESGNRVRGNQAYRNQVADIVWDGKGSANKFSSNKCDSSKPGGLCT
jgi:parallel beta-helix repeat protein